MGNKLRYQSDYIKFLEDIGFSFEEACHFVKESIKRRLGSHTTLMERLKECCEVYKLNYSDTLRMFVEIPCDIIHSEIFEMLSEINFKKYTVKDIKKESTSLGFWTQEFRE